MLVLKIIGGAILFFALLMFFTQWYEKLERKYQYDFFDTQLFVVAALSNSAIYFGHMWYLEALKVNGDRLNGELLITFGIWGLIYVVYRNIKGTNFFIGILGSVLQLALFGAGTVFAIIAIFGLIAALSETKPTYVINND